MKRGDNMEKIKACIYLEEDIYKQFRELAKKEDVRQNRLFKDMLQAYLILNAKDQKEEK